MEHRSKEAIRAGARKGARALAVSKRQRRNVQVGRALEDGGLMNVAEIAAATGRTPTVVRAALRERIEEGRTEKVGKQYRRAA